MYLPGIHTSMCIHTCSCCGCRMVYHDEGNPPAQYHNVRLKITFTFTFTYLAYVQVHIAVVHSCRILYHNTCKTMFEIRKFHIQLMYLMYATYTLLLPLHNCVSESAWKIPQCKVKTFTFHVHTAVLTAGFYITIKRRHYSVRLEKKSLH